METMASLRHQNLCQVLGCVIIEREVWLVIEFVEGGNLHDCITRFRPLSLELQLSFAIQAAKAINFLHTSPTPVLHKILNAFKFLVTKNKSTLLLTAFGFSKAKEFLTSHTATIGTLKWTAPEVLNDSPMWSEKADIYSLGMVLLEIFTGETPFKDDTNMITIMKKISNGIRPSIPDSCPLVSHISSLVLCFSLF
jgi:serine/threonine protein kinase